MTGGRQDAPGGGARAILRETLVRYHLRSIGPEEVVYRVPAAELLIPALPGRRDAQAKLAQDAFPGGIAAVVAFTSDRAFVDWSGQTATSAVATGQQLALVATAQGTPRIAIDLGSPETEYVLRAPAVTAIATENTWMPPWEDDRVLSAFAEPAREYAIITEISLAMGDVAASGLGPEMLVRLMVMRGLDAGQLKLITAELTEKWQADRLIQARVDSFAVNLRPDPAMSL